MFIIYLIIIVLIFLRGMFAGFDTALMYTDKYKIAKKAKKDKKAKKIKFLIDDKIKFWGVIEICMISAELLLIEFVAEEFTKNFALKIQTLGIQENLATLAAILIIAIILTFILLVFGTILPKQIARNNPEKFAYRYINIVSFFAKINYLFELVVRKASKLFAGIFNIEEDPEAKLTEKQIKMIISEGKAQGALEDLEKQIAIQALKFDDIEIKNIMIKKENIDFLNIETSSKEIWKNIGEYNFTRIPVYKDNTDYKKNIIGIFNIKDLIIEYSKTNRMNISLKKYLRPIEFVNKNEKVSETFKKMQKDEIYMAIVIDDDMKVCGLVTLEDILEMLVGKIFDEYEKK